MGGEKVNEEKLKEKLKEITKDVGEKFEYSEELLNKILASIKLKE